MQGFSEGAEQGVWRTDVTQWGPGPEVRVVRVGRRSGRESLHNLKQNVKLMYTFWRSLSYENSDLMGREHSWQAYALFTEYRRRAS